jgi:hypothetical protein
MASLSSRCANSAKQLSAPTSATGRKSARTNDSITANLGEAACADSFQNRCSDARMGARESVLVPGSRKDSFSRAVETTFRRVQRIQRWQTWLFLRLWSNCFWGLAQTTGLHPIQRISGSRVPIGVGRVAPRPLNQWRATNLASGADL